MGDVVQIRARVAELLGFIAIDSKERPDSYESVSLAVRILENGSGSEPTWHKFDSGDFVADWNAALDMFKSEAAKQSYASVRLNLSSTVNTWQHDSCAYIAIAPTSADPFLRWRRATDAEESGMRHAYADARTDASNA